jgi:hypothetical protein
MNRLRRPSAALVVLVLAAVTVCAGPAGCGSTARFVGAEREFEEQDQVRREQAGERIAARRRAERLQRRITAVPRPAVESTVTCHIEYGPVEPVDGIIPIACGDLGRRWPLKVDRGYLRCEPGATPVLKEVVFTAPGGAEYAVNIGAEGAGYRDIRPLRRKSGTRAIWAALAERGEELCR